MSKPGPTALPATPVARSWGLGGILVGLLATFSFAYDLPSERSFVDEWAYLSQTYYADLWLSGATNHPSWLDYMAYDLPPLPKYLFGLALRIGGYPRPGREAALQWYQNTSRQCGPHAMLVAARWPAVVCGSLGCVALYGLGTLASGRRVGFLAALGLMIDPLYRLHARRAMSDVIAESLILLSIWAALYTWQRLLAGRAPARAWLVATLAGFAGGMAALAKLNGALAMIVVSVWAVLAVLLPGVSWKRKLAVVLAALVSGIVSLATFVLLNPFVTAHPRGVLPPSSARFVRMAPAERMHFLAEFRMSVSQGQKTMFRHNALESAWDKLATVVVQGFGRFGPFGPHESRSWIRYDPVQDWGAALWFPLVLAGGWCLLRLGRRQLAASAPPTAWAAASYVVVSWIVVASYLPLAWDRYYLSIQPGSSLLAAVAVATAAGRLHGAWTRRDEGA